jgi:hypothetical protein
MTKLQVKVSEYPEQVTQSGRYTIQSVKGPTETRFGLALILIVTNTKGEERSVFVPYAVEISSRTSLARVMAAFGDDTERWSKRRVDITIGSDGRRRIDPVPEPNKP